MTLLIRSFSSRESIETASMQKRLNRKRDDFISSFECRRQHFYLQ